MTAKEKYEKYSATLRIYGNIQDMSVIGMRLGLEPTRVRRRGESMEGTSERMELDCWEMTAPDATMYLWLPVPDGVDDWAWVQALIDHDGVVVTPGVAFGDGGRGYFRISLVRDEPTLASAARAIASRRAELVHAA